MSSLGKERCFWTFFRTNSISVPDFNCNKWKGAVWSATKRGPRRGEGSHETVFHAHEHENQAERLRQQRGPGIIGQKPGREQEGRPRGERSIPGGGGLKLCTYRT